MDKETAQKLVPNLCVPFDYAFYMPQAVNVNPLRYLQVWNPVVHILNTIFFRSAESSSLTFLQGLYLACEDLVKQSSASALGQKELYLQKVSIQSLLELEGNVLQIKSFRTTSAVKWELRLLDSWGLQTNMMQL